MPTCSKQEFTCNTTGDCIPLQWVCDKTRDCDDSSDEYNCRKCHNFLLIKLLLHILQSVMMIILFVQTVNAYNCLIVAMVYHNVVMAPMN